MQVLTNKQKKHLLQCGNKLKSVVLIGKDGITPSVIASINDYLQAHELIKVAVLKSSEVSITEAVAIIEEETHATLVQKIGLTMLFYLKTKKERIIFPV